MHGAPLFRIDKGKKFLGRLAFSMITATIIYALAYIIVSFPLPTILILLLVLLTVNIYAFLP